MQQANEKGVSRWGGKDKVQNFVFVRLLCFEMSCLSGVSVEVNVDWSKQTSSEMRGLGDGASRLLNENNRSSDRGAAESISIGSSQFTVQIAETMGHVQSPKSRKDAARYGGCDGLVGLGGTAINLSSVKCWLRQGIG